MRFVAPLLLMLGLALPALAQEWSPSRPVRLIVPWSAGGSTDAIGRALAARLQETVGQPVIVENRPGANAQVGTEAAVKSAPDGHTLTVIELPHAVAPAVVAHLPYDVQRDLAPVAMLGASPLILSGQAGAGAPADIAAYLKFARSASPPIAIGNSGTGSSAHLAAAVFGERAGIKLIHVPYKGAAPALADVASGAVQGCFATLASGAGLVSSGKLRPVAVASSRRMSAAVVAAVPTFAEAGLGELEMLQWWAFAVPASTPAETIERLRRETLAALEHPQVKDRFAALGVEPRPSTRDELRAFIRAELARWQDAAKRAGLKPE